MEKKLPLPSCPVAILLTHPWGGGRCFRVKVTYENGKAQYEYIKSEPKMTITIRDKKESDADEKENY